MKKATLGQAISDAQICLNGSFSIGAQEHFYLEGQVALAIPSDDGGNGSP